MTRLELIQKVASANPHLHHRDIERVVTVTLKEIGDARGFGDRHKLKGFGAFAPKPLTPRRGRNPRTGEYIEISRR